MARGRSARDHATIEMALVGYAVQKRKIEEKIREIHSLLGGKRVKVGPSQATAEPRAKRVLTAAARRRIGVAQRKRWAEHRRMKALAGEK